MKFYRCENSGNLIQILYSKEEISKTPIRANDTDAATEKHVPVCEYDEAQGIVTIKVGSVTHPMDDNHYIPFVSLETTNGEYRHDFKPGDEPVCRFRLLDGEKPLAAYEYCNLHGLWKAEF